MNYFFKKTCIGLVLLVAPALSYAASITLSAPDRAVATRQPVVVRLFLDTEKKTVSGIGGDFSFPSDMFTLGEISTVDGVVPLWINQPHISPEKYFDNRTHVTFEGIFPGGYSGVRSPYYQGEKTGIIFTVTLIPKNKGTGVFLVDNMVLNAFSSDAEPIPVDSAIQMITVPDLLPAQSDSPETALVRVKKESLSAFITHDPLINNNDWYLVVNDQDSSSVIADMFVAETDDYDAEVVKESDWHTTKVPYVLLFQDRTKNVHVKVVYSDHTYTTITLHAVENYSSISHISRILVSVAIVLLLLYLYGKDLFILVKKKH